MPALALLALCPPVLIGADKPKRDKPDKPEKLEIWETRKEQRGAAGGKVALPETSSPQAARLRGLLEIADDAEWEIIAARMAKVEELRWELAGFGVAGGKGAAVARDRKRGGERDGKAEEQSALRAAVRDKLPDAEIKARLARVHETYVQKQAQLAKAQEELRAVLTVRQEAVAVMYGLLPP